MTVLVTELVTLGETDDDAEAHAEAPGDCEPLEHLLTLEDTDEDGQADGVDPAGAHTGPMLNVARCVPAMDATGDAERMDGDPERDIRAVAIVCVTDGERDCVGQCDTDGVRDTESDADVQPERVASDGEGRSVELKEERDFWESVTDGLLAVPGRDALIVGKPVKLGVMH